MRFILKIKLILVYVLFLSNSLLLADNIDKEWLEAIMQDTWKIQNDSLLRGWSQYEIDEYNAKEDSSSSSMDRLFWNESKDTVDVSYFNRYQQDSIGSIRIYLNKEAPVDDLEGKIETSSIEEKLESVVLNGVKFNFYSSQIEIEVFLGGLTTDNLEIIQNRLRVAVVSNEILNPWLRIANPYLKEEFKDDEYYLSNPQQEVIDFLINKFEQHNLKKGALIQLPTGMGKTRAIFAFIKRIEEQKNTEKKQSPLHRNIKRIEEQKNTEKKQSPLHRNYRVLWFVSGIDVLRQTREDFNNIFSKDSMFGLYGGTNTEDNQANLTNYNDLAVSLDTLIRKDKNNENDEDSRKNIELIKNWILSSDKPVIIIVDEAHRSNAPTYLEDINNIKNDEEYSSKIEGLIGMTATPYRSDLDLPEIYDSWYMWEISDDNQRKIKTAYDQLLSAARQGYIPIPYFISLNQPSLLKEQINTESKAVEVKNEYDEVKLENNFIPILLQVLKANNKVLIYHGRGKDSNGNSTGKQLSFMQFLDNHQEIVDAMNVKVYAINSLNRVDEDGNDILGNFRKDKRAVLNLTGVGDYGTDIPDVDCIIFLDESESQVKIVQRVGRSVRLSKAKPVTTIIDWNNGRILENLKKKIFFNISPEELKTDIDDKFQEIQTSNTILDIADQLLKLKETEFITTVVPSNSLAVEEISTSPIVKTLIELCKKMEKILNKKLQNEPQGLSPEEMLLKEIIEHMMKYDIRREYLETFKKILEYRKVNSRTELIEVLNWYAASNQIGNRDVIEQAIMEIVISWIKEYGRYPEYKDYGREENQVGISRIMIKKFFGDPNDTRDTSSERLKERILDKLDIDIGKGILDPDRVREIKLMILTTDLNQDYWFNNETRIKKLQKIYRDQVIYWIRKNGKYPMKNDCDQNSENWIGISINRMASVFGNTENPSGWEVLKEQILDSNKGFEFAQMILVSNLSKEYWLKNDNRRRKIRSICIKLIYHYIYNDMNSETTKKVVKIDEKFNLSNEEIEKILGISCGKLYRSVSSNEVGIFENFADLKEQLILYDNTDEKVQDIVNGAFSKRKRNRATTKIEPQQLPNKEEVINAVFAWIDDLEENEKHWPTRNEVLSKIYVIKGIHRRNIIGDGRSDKICVFRNNKEFVEEAVRLDSEGKYLKYIIRTAMASDIYEKSDIKEKMQDCFIKDYLIPWVIKNKRWPMGNDYRVNDPTKIPFSKLKIIKGADTNETNALFDNIQELMDRVLILSKENQNISEKELLCQYIIEYFGMSNVLNSSNSVEIFDGFEGRQSRQILQEFFIRKYVYPFKMANEGKYPKILIRKSKKSRTYLEFKESFVFGVRDEKGNIIRKGLFDSNRDLKRQYESLCGCVFIFSK